jgi:hypothetical protein
VQHNSDLSLDLAGGPATFYDSTYIGGGGNTLRVLKLALPNLSEFVVGPGEVVSTGNIRATYDIRAGRHLYAAGNIVATGNISSTGGTCCASDGRLKQNVAPLTRCLEKVQQLQGVSYDWRREEFPEMAFTERKQIGLIAQDVEEVFPEAVITRDDGYKALAYDKLTAVLVEALKEQQAQIESLKTQMEQMRAGK